MNVVPIELPAVLQAHRGHLTGTEELADPAGEIRVLQKALEQACEYGQQLWRRLDAQRHYLLDCLPPAPPLDAPQPIDAGASPTGPGDDAGWDHWMTAYADATSALAGPHGDSGYGRTEADHEMTTRRRAAQNHT